MISVPLFLARDGAPAYVPLVICDHFVGEIAAGAILAAVVKRNAGGGGSSLEVPMFETLASFAFAEHLCGSLYDPPRVLNHLGPQAPAIGWPIKTTFNVR